ncbi:hypothetical protein QQX10_04780 [Demequina sp. SYSU T00039]|uniref:Lipoprotein n=1 Tax=Demequina lignilytica TaxID=3051663 RepID=A0AAW7M037_9MICO|nr:MULTISPECIES: hypothetical protein [unclassified Demequina]MDN4477310.1 hypothetical protein [Demequina sp. SYSU T00039-1]MDN4487483.1 hypothetical protein [Demequina sp. SYSU T00039]
MELKRTATAGVAALLGAALIAGCTSESASDTQAGGAETPADTSTATEPEPTEASPAAEETSEAPVSDIEAAVQTFVTALDELGIDHTEPVRAEVGASGAKAVFDITINGYDAGINVFPDGDTLAAWQELSDSFGGIHVAWEHSALSLNSSDGIANSAEIAPLIADQVGGEARGV